MEQDPITSQDCLSIVITLQTSFLQWVHGHRLVDGPKSKRFWEGKPAEQQFNFGGVGKCQFNTKDQIESFIIAFNEELDRYSIDRKHKYALWYMILFLDNGYEHQSIANNKHNHLHEYADFLLDLITDADAQIQLLEKDPQYQRLVDPLTLEYFYAKTSIASAMPIEELIEYFPNGENADDVIRFLRITVFDKQLYLPEDIALAAISSSQRELLTSDDGKQSPQIQVPRNLLYQTLTFIVNNILDAHKRAETAFYYEIIDAETTLTHLVKSNSTQKKHHISSRLALARVGTLITDYLKEYNVTEVKRTVGLFLFDYFALFKVHKIPTDTTVPDDYTKLRAFYLEQGLKDTYIVYLMKELWGK